MGSFSPVLLFPYFVFLCSYIIVCLQLCSAFLNEYTFLCFFTPFVTVKENTWYIIKFIFCFLAGPLDCLLPCHFVNCKVILFSLKQFDVLNYLEEIHKSSVTRVLFWKQNAFHKCYLITVGNLKIQGSLRLCRSNRSQSACVVHLPGQKEKYRKIFQLLLA